MRPDGVLFEKSYGFLISGEDGHPAVEGPHDREPIARVALVHGARPAQLEALVQAQFKAYEGPQLSRSEVTGLPTSIAASPWLALALACRGEKQEEPQKPGVFFKPGSALVLPGEAVQLTAFFLSGTDEPVTWSVREAGGPSHSRRTPGEGSYLCAGMGPTPNRLGDGGVGPTSAHLDTPLLPPSVLSPTGPALILLLMVSPDFFCVSSGFCSVFGDSGRDGTFFVSALMGLLGGGSRPGALRPYRPRSES